MAKDLTKQYEAELREQFDWDGLHKDASDNPEGTTYLGSVLNLSPSGKYYQPFACGNVLPCPTCKGESTVPNKKSDPDLHALAQSVDHSLTAYALQHCGIYADWPRNIKKLVNDARRLKDMTAPTKTCPTCHGVGSEEAYKDECWQEALEHVAEEHGMYVTGSEGDGCDILVGITGWEDKEESEEEEMVGV